MNLRFRDAPRLTIAALIAATVLFGLGAFEPGPATAAAALEIDGSCEPAIRPNEPALVHCSVTLTNTGGAALTDLGGSVLIAEGCDIPGRFAFIDRTENGGLVRTEPQGLIFDVPDLEPGETATSVTRIATESFSTGPTGGSITISSISKPAATATVDLCWDVQNSAAAPSGKITVTKTMLGTTDDAVLVDEPEAPPRPVGGEPVPILPPPPPTGNQVGVFEIMIVNVSDVMLSDVTLLDVPTGDAVLESAEPPPSSIDSLGRPIWDIGQLDPGGEFRVLARFAPPAGETCSFADDIAIVTATDGDGSREENIAFSDFGVQVGTCVFERPDFCWHYPPNGDDFPAPAPCDEEICWSTSPVTEQPRAVFDCAEDIDYCWFIPPGEGFEEVLPCDLEVCWLSFGPAEFGYYSQVPCDVEFCEYTSPDGDTTTGDCALPICWAEDPIDGFWQQLYGCEEFFGGDACWFVAPDGSRASVLPCEEEICWVSFAPSDFIGEVPCDFEFCQYTAPDESTTTTSDCDFPVCWSSPPASDEWQQVYDCGEFQEWCWFAPPGSPETAILNPCDYPLSFAVNLPDGGMVHDPWQLTIFDEAGFDWCWPVPPETGAFYTFPVFCDDIESIYWFQQDDGTYVLSYGPTRGCRRLFPIDDQPIPGPIRIVEEAASAGDLLIEEPCIEEDKSETGVQGSSIPVELAPAVITPAALDQGSVEPIEPQASLSVTPVEMDRGEVVVIEALPSADVTPAVLEPSDRIEPFPVPEFPDNIIVMPVDETDRPTAPPGPRDSVEPDTYADVDVDADAEAAEVAITFPKTGSSNGTSTSPYLWPALTLALAGAAASTAGLLLRTRRRL